jgi:hypothetical protein
MDFGRWQYLHAGDELAHFRRSIGVDALKRIHDFSALISMTMNICSSS